MSREPLAESADYIWRLNETQGNDMHTKLYWEDCLTISAFLHRMGFRRTEEATDTIDEAIAKGYFIKHENNEV